jgi:8-amino-7-oxononanoate synthase
MRGKMLLALEHKLLQREKQGNLRLLKLIGPKRVDFSSNDYLGLARSPELASLIEEEIKNHERHRFGSTGSRLLTGNTEYAQALEAQIALFHGYAAGLLFNCGYMANLGLLSTLLNAQDTVYFDACVHASMHDGIKLSKAKAFPFRHNDLDHLEKRLKQPSAARKRVICVESIYSMDGSKAPLAEICQLAKHYQAEVIVDEAHATGVWGTFGKGVATDNIFKVVTFSKALGAHGAIVLGSNLLKQTLINFATPFIYTTALPLQALAAIKCAYSLLPKLENERNHLKDLVQIFREHFPHASETHIQSIRCQGNDHAKQMAETMAVHGYDVRPLLSPTVQRGHEILRVNLHAFNSKEELMALRTLI